MPSQTYRMLQYGFHVEYDDPRVGELVDGLLGWFRLQGANGLPTYSLKHSPRGGTMLGYLNGRRFHEAATVGGLITRLLWRVNAEALKRTRTHILVHAAAASWSGRGIILPAAMESGKTTLVAGLVRAGFGYLSDEAAAIDPATGLMHPYPKPLSMGPDSVEALGDLSDRLPPEFAWGSRLQYQIRPTDLRQRSIGRPCRVRFVVAPRYDPGVETKLHPISRAEALTILVENSLNSGRWRARGVPALGRVVAGADCYRLSVGSLDEAVRAIQEIVEAPSRVVR